MIKDIQEQILKLKKEKNACILVHCYQSHDILEIADYVGDSFGLAQKAAKTDCENVIMCGVRFMAETVKILSPQKKVFLPKADAGCPMAEQMNLETLDEMKKKYPGYAVVAYINTTSELKTACDVCVTSSSAVQICSKLDNDKILFIPDPNLGNYVQKQMPEKKFAFFNGGCPRHLAVTLDDALKAKELPPHAELLVHPECRPDVVAEADYVGSTTGIMAYARKSEKKEFIIGTEHSIVEHLQYECPDKMFYPISSKLMCHNMKLTTLVDILNVLKGKGGEEIVLSDEVMEGASRCINRMIALG